MRLGPFELESEIARGGMGSVWRGRHVTQGLPVAAKVISSERARDPLYLEAFQREVRAVATMDHPGIVRVFDQGAIPPRAEAESSGALVAGSPYLVMEYLEHGTLRDVPRGAPWSLLHNLLLGLLAALAHAHARGVIHRDLKPNNVLLTAPPKHPHPGVKLTDFGIAHAATDAHGELPEHLTGTPHFMAPEQIGSDTRDYGPWTDLYALGCLAFQLITGQPPFWRPDAELSFTEIFFSHLYGELPRLEGRAHVPRGLDDWLHTLLAKPVHQRFCCAADARAALLELGPATPPAPGSSEDSPDPALTTWDDTLLARPTTHLGTQLTRPTVLTAPPELPDPTSTQVGPLSPVRAPITELPPSPPARTDAVELQGAGLGLFGLRPVPFVGRARERALLWRQLVDVHRTGHARAVVLKGPSGVGKTRLGQWLARTALEHGAGLVVRASHEPTSGPSEGLPLAIAKALRAADLRGSALLDRAVDHVKRRGGSLRDALELAALLDPDSAHANDRRLHLATPRERYVATSRWLSIYARERPVVMLLDDVQWGADALAFADYLLKSRGQDVPALLVVAAREDALLERPLERSLLDGLIALDCTESLELPPLPDSAHQELIRGLLSFTPDLAAQLAACTAGHPMFAVQLVHELVQQGKLSTTLRGFELDAEQALPSSLEALWLLRLRRLEGEPSRLEALEVAAALGHHVDRELWSQACVEGDIPRAPHLEGELELKRLAVLDETGWSFAHSTLREALIRHAQEQGRWAHINAWCAQVLAQAQSPAAWERLGLHAREAGHMDTALDAWLRAARGYLASCDFHQATLLLEQRQALCETLRLPSDDPRPSAGDLAQASCAVLRGRPQEALPWLERVEDALRGQDWPRIHAGLRFGRGVTAQSRGRTQEALTAFEEALALYRELPEGGPPLLLAKCTQGRADILTQIGQPTVAIKLFEQALEHYIEARDLKGQGRCHVGLGEAWLRLGDRTHADTELKRAREVFESAGVRDGLAQVLSTTGILAAHDEKLDEALAAFERAARVFAELDSADIVAPLGNLAFIHLRQGRYARARAVLEEAFPKARKAARGGYLLYLAVAMLPAAAAEHDRDAFDTSYREAWAMLKETRFADADLVWAAELASTLWADTDPSRSLQAQTLAQVQRGNLELAKEKQG